MENRVEKLSRYLEELATHKIIRLTVYFGYDSSYLGLDLQRRLHTKLWISNYGYTTNNTCLECFDGLHGRQPLTEKGQRLGITDDLNIKYWNIGVPVGIAVITNKK